MDELKKDSRFSHIAKDPRFRPASKKESKLKIDRRFSSMFKDPKFKLKYTVDKRGRPLLKERTTRDDMKKFYHIDRDEEQSSSSSSEEEEITKTKKKSIVTGDEKLDELLQSDDTDEDEENEDDEDEDDEDEKEDEEKDDEIDQSSSSDDDEAPELDDGVEWNDFDEKCVRSEDMSRRLAICNMDWDRVRASDIFVLLNSWKPTDGIIKSVTIYPSEYGLKQMEIEKVHGPIPETTKPVELTDQDGTDNGYQNNAEEEPELPEVKSDDEETIAENFNQNDDSDVTDPVIRERLRKYQLNRLKYYYAVAECDTVGTAAKIYEECDGLEYETSAVRLDLRFIPDSVTFDESLVHDRCTELPEKTIYKPILFRNTALTQTKVRCTWDETPLDRRLVMRKKYTMEEIEKLDVDAYLASESEDEGNDEDDDDNNITSDIEDDEKSKSDKNDENGVFKVPDVPNEKKNTKKNRPIVKAPSVLSSQDDIERYRALLLGFDDDSDSKKKKKSKKKITNFFDAERSDDDDDDAIPRRAQVDDDEDDDDDPSDIDMEITWQPGLKSKTDEKSETKADKKNNKNNKKDKRSSKDEDDDSNAEEQEDQKKFNRDSLELLTLGDETETKRDYNLRQMMKAHKQAIKAESKKKKTSKKFEGKSSNSDNYEASGDQFKLNLDDKRFSAVYNQAAFNIDQSDPHFKATAGTQRIIDEKIKKRKFEQISTPSTTRNDHHDLVAKLKRKSARKD